MDINNRNSTNNIENLITETMEKEQKNKGLFIARPKKKVPDVAEESTNRQLPKDRSKDSVFIAYPKAPGASAETIGDNPLSNDVKEQLFVAYPNGATKASESIKQKITHKSPGNGYVARPKNTGSGTITARFLNAPIIMFKNNVYVLNILQFLRLKVS